MDGTESAEVRVELAVRSLGPGEGKTRQDRAIERLRELERDGAIDEVTVSVWGKRVPLDGAAADTGPAEEIRSAVEEFRGWASRNDLSIGTFVRAERVRSEFTGEDFRALKLPTMVLAEYEDGDLRWVSPCLDPDSGTDYTVQDRIETLAARGRGRGAAPTPTATTPVAEE